MDIALKEKFIQVWKRYFGAADLPMVFYYTDTPMGEELIQSSSGHRCIMADLAKVFTGRSICFNADSFSCFGGKRYLGYSQELMKNFEYFLSCGIPGRLEGERYKKTPELVKDFIEKAPKFEAPGKFIVFKRWDKLQESDELDVVIFFAPPDVLSGLFTLANFDVSDPIGVICPFSAGCGSIVQHPYLEKESDRPKAVLGMFDVSARPYVSADVLTFSIPINKFVTMIDNVEKSFLITQSWSKIQSRIK